MNKELIKQLLEDDETRLEIASWFGFKIEGDDSPKSSWDYDDIMVEALNKLNDTLVKGDMITIEVPEGGMWVRGTYISTQKTGDVTVCRLGGIYAGKRVDLAIKGEEGEADV